MRKCVTVRFVTVTRGRRGARVRITRMRPPAPRVRASDRERSTATPVGRGTMYNAHTCLAPKYTFTFYGSAYRAVKLLIQWAIRRHRRQLVERGEKRTSRIRNDRGDEGIDLMKETAKDIAAELMRLFFEQNGSCNDKAKTLRDIVVLVAILAR